MRQSDAANDSGKHRATGAPLSVRHFSRWVRAVDRDGRFGRWEYRYLRHPADLAEAVFQFDLDVSQ